MTIVFVIAQDWALRVGVRAELRAAGLDARGMRSLDDAGRTVAGGDVPSVVVVEGEPLADGSSEQFAAFATLARRVPVVLVDSHAYPAFPGASPDGGAPPICLAAVLHRPVRVGQVVAAVVKLLQGTSA